MSFLSFLFAEIRYRIVGYLLNVLVVTIAIGAVLFILLTSKASKRSIQLITKNMGQNMILLHEQTKLEDYYTASGQEIFLPESMPLFLFCPVDELI